MTFRLARHWSFDSSWNGLDAEFQENYPNNLIGKLDQFLSDELASGRDFYPAEEDIFKAFRLTPLDDVRVVIVGQDPYADGRATGLAFSVCRDKELPRSLRNIYDRLEVDLDHPVARCGDLRHWAKQGVLLLNSVLTVRAGESDSHRRGGWWTQFTTKALRLVDNQRSGVVFCLWGEHAESKRRHLVHTTRISPGHVLTASHPSPRTFRKPFRSYSSFTVCNHFSEVNRLLGRQGHEIYW